MSLACATDKKCAICGGIFHPRSSMATVCSQRCAMRKVAGDKKTERKQTKERKAALQTIPELIKIAQREFNAYIRARDKAAGHACISSGRALDWSGNGVDAGHYRSVGAAPHLRFDERNCHAQSKHDNQYRSGNAVDYRIGLIARIGLREVEALESENEIWKWTREELRAIAKNYRQKRKQLEKAQ